MPGAMALGEPVEAADGVGASGWLYRKLYVGMVAGGLDHLVTRLLPEVRDCAGVDRWFYIRYVDQGGLHLRLRARATEAPEQLHARLDPLIEHALGELPGVPAPLYRPALVLGPPRPRGTDEVIRVVAGAYRPEVEKFGAHGMDVAERLFQRSSELAIDVLAGELAGGVPRKTLVPCLMQSVADAFVPAAGSGLWREYSRHWLDLLTVPTEWRRRFAAKGAELAARGVPVIAPNAQLPAEARALLDDWRRALEPAARAHATAHDDPPVPATGLAFQYAHLMNNRLGVQPLEEAYYATLMTKDASE